jgi:hypothetical protein
VRHEILGEEVPARLERIEALLERMTERQDRFEERQDRFEERQARFEELQQEFEERLNRVTAAIEDLTRRVVRLEEIVRVLTETVANMNGRLGNVEGWIFERDFKAAARLARYFRRIMEVDLGNFEDLDLAHDAGTVSDDDLLQLAQADFVFRARPRGRPSEEVILVGEVSITIDAGDVSRALARADILRKAGLAAEPVVGGKRIAVEARRLAEASGVLVMVDSPQAPEQTAA